MPAGPVANGPLVGRSEELARLVGLVGVEPSNAPKTAVLLSGDAGVGKTRLLAELRTRAQDRGWRVLVGHCLDFGDSALAYLPFSEAFGRLVTETPELAASLVEASPAVASLMPGRRLLSELDHGPGPRIGRADLFEGVGAALRELSRAAPLLLIIEDVHWADQSTRELLSFLFTRQSADFLTIVASYRSDDMHRRHPLRAAAAEWFRLPGVSRVQLQPLADADVRALVRVLHPTPLLEANVRQIVARAEGNAFFTEELVAAAGLGGRALPTDLADLLLLRLDQLDDSTRLAVRAASVAGRQVSHDLLTHVVGIGDDSLERALRAAVEHNALVAVGADGYAFRHALLAEAVYDDLLPGERVRLHAAYAEALAKHDLDGTAAELARHARLAHDLPTAIAASIQAGDEAMAVAGPDEAARHYETALALLADADTLLAAGPVDVVDLAIKASTAAAAAGQPFRAVALVKEALDGLATDAPASQRAALLAARAAVEMLSDSSVDILALTAEALQLTPQTPPSALRAQVLSAHARASLDRNRDDEAVRWATDALHLGRQLDLPDVIADAATTLARLQDRSGDSDSSRRALEQTVAEARTAGEVAAELRGLFNLGSLHYEAGRLTEALSVYESAAGRAREAGRPWAPYGIDARALAGVVAYVAGDWDHASRIIDVAGESPPAMAEAVLTSVGLSVAAGRGRHDALDLLPNLRPWWDRDGLVAIFTGGPTIDLHGDRGDPTSAIEVHDRVVSAVCRLWQVPAFEAQIRLSGLLLGQLGTAAGRSGGAERTTLASRGERLVAAVSEVLEHSRLRGRRRGPEGKAWLARVSAEHARLRWLTGSDPPDEDELVTAWLSAVAGFEAFGHVHELARSRLRLAGILRAVGRPAEAAEHLREARSVAVQLGAEPLLTELRGLGVATSGPAAAESRRSDQLTPREHEVLLLVAQGRSNSDIARHLYISAKTVSVHVSNIMAKLGAASRTEAAALARRRGLLTDPGP
ncbi:MAG: AAA family ATPase [Pseudonocardiales bacterium]